MGEQLQKRCIKKTCDTNLHTDVSYIHVHKHMHTHAHNHTNVCLNENANIMCFFPQFVYSPH